MSTAALFWVFLAMLCISYVATRYVWRLERDRERASMMLDNPEIRDDIRTTNFGSKP